MNAPNFHFWQKWLTWANVMTIGVGILVAFAGNSIFFDLHNAGTEGVFFPETGFNPEIIQLKNWLFGIIGGTIVGFHVLMAFISENAFKRRERWAYQAMWAGMLSWFLIDSGISLYSGAVHNVVMINLVALVLIGLPLVITWRDFAAAAGAGES